MAYYFGCHPAGPAWYNAPLYYNGGNCYYETWQRMGPPERQHPAYRDCMQRQYAQRGPERESPHEYASREGYSRRHEQAEEVAQSRVDRHQQEAEDRFRTDYEHFWGHEWHSRRHGGRLNSCEERPHTNESHRRDNGCTNRENSYSAPRPRSEDEDSDPEHDFYDHHEQSGHYAAFERTRRPYSFTGSQGRPKGDTEHRKTRNTGSNTGEAEAKLANQEKPSTKNRCDCCHDLIATHEQSAVLNGFVICAQCHLDGLLPASTQFKKWHDRVTALIEGQAIVSFPFMPPIFIMHCSQCVKDAALRACLHDVERCFNAGGITDLKRERIKWHPDRFVNCCTKQFKEKGRVLSEEMFKLMGQIIDTP